MADERIRQAVRMAPRGASANTARWAVVTEAPGRATYLRAVLCLIAGMTALRAVGAATWPIGIDEAYYWLWARHLDWGYLDHPPLIAYVIFLTTRLGDSALWVRTGALVIGAATTYSLYLLGRELFDGRAGAIAAVLFQALPMSGMQAVPDTPLLLAWTLVLRFAWQATHGRPSRWQAVGLAAGLGLLSKLSMGFLGFGLAAFIAFRKRSWLRRGEVYGAALIALLLFLPFVYWNSTHDWATIRFILHERPRQITLLAPDVAAAHPADLLLRVGTTPRGPMAIAMLLVQQSLQSVLLYPAFAGVIWASWRRRRDERHAYLVWTAIPALGFPLVVGYTMGFAQASWTVPVYVGTSIALAALWQRRLAALIAANALVVVYLLLIPLLPIPYFFEDAVFGWKEAAARVGSELGALCPPVVAVADRYGAAGQLAFYERLDFPVTLLPRPNPASVWPPVESFRGANAVAVLDERWSPRVNWTDYAARVEEAPPLTIYHAGRPVRTFRIIRLRGLLLPPAAATRTDGGRACRNGTGP